ncbi:MAG TPA: NAD(P)/FAD-dependent oxidoreductase [Candidatus Acetothermia bacterium]|nr:NAD(P)/FAD-dependent oxidoreductase [Candidatus Acetothermia bacterium]
MRFVIVGGGLAGFTAARTLRTSDVGAEITVVEAEPVAYYLRPGLIEVLAGRKTLAEITPFPRAWFEHRRIRYRSGSAVVELDVEGHRVTLASGERLGYDRLLLACGAAGAQPELPGVAGEGVFALRQAADVERIRTRAQRARAAAVIGGGWLGIEVARALHDLGLAVTVLERGRWLLHRQLDREGAEVLTALLARQGVQVRVGVECAAIRGQEEVAAVRLTTGEEMAVGLVVISAGIQPRIALAAAAGLATNRGVIVDDHLATSASDVYAAGDVAEWRGQIYGIIPAAREQGEIAARNMIGPESVRYAGTTRSNTLRVAGVDLVCLGETQPQGGPRQELRAVDRDAGRYVKLVLGADGELAGAILLGAADIAPRVEELAQAGVPVDDDLKQLLGPQG